MTRLCCVIRSHNVDNFAFFLQHFVTIFRFEGLIVLIITLIIVVVDYVDLIRVIDCVMIQ